MACHAERLNQPVTPHDCLGFTACETCTKLGDPPGWSPDKQQEAAAAWSEWLTQLHNNINR